MIPPMPDREGRTIPAITLWQPWACLIEIGVKPYETRPKRAPHFMLGQRIAIHAAARPVVTDMDQETLDAITEAFGNCGWNFSLPRGVVVCTATLSACVPADRVPCDPFGDYSNGRFAWKLDDVRPVQPHIPAKGQQRYGWPWHTPEGFVP